MIKMAIKFVNGLDKAVMSGDTDNNTTTTNGILQKSNQLKPK